MSNIWGITSKNRLYKYRKEAEDKKWVKPLTWRDTRNHHPSIWSTNTGTRNGNKIYSDDVDRIS